MSVYEKSVNLSSLFCKRSRNWYLHKISFGIFSKERTQLLKKSRYLIDKLHKLLEHWCTVGLYCRKERRTIQHYTHILLNTLHVLYVGGKRREYAKWSLEQPFDSEIKDGDDDTVCYHCYHQLHTESVQLFMCSGCKVKYYCNGKHQKKKRRGARSLVIGCFGWRGEG